MDGRQKESGPMPGRAGAAGREAEGERRHSHGRADGAQLLDSRTRMVMAQRDAEKKAVPLLKLSAARIAALRRIAADGRGNSAETQHRRLLRAFRGGPLTSIDAKEHLDVLGFPARVAELELAGHRFVRRWVLQATAMGRTHRVVQIALVRGEVNTD